MTRILRRAWADSRKSNADCMVQREDFQSSRMKVPPSLLVTGHIRLGSGSTASIAFAAWANGRPEARPPTSAESKEVGKCAPRSRVLTQQGERRVGNKRSRH